MGFWIRNSIFAVILIGLAWGFLANQDFLLSFNEATETQPTIQTQPTTQIKATTDDDTSANQEPPKKTETKGDTTKYQQGRAIDNAAAEGLSNFYAKIYGDGISKKGPKIRNNIIFLPEPEGNLIEILQAREMVVRPYRDTWRGSTASRPFRKNQTLYQKLAEYAAKDGLEVIWWLNRDFVVKDAFRINKDILKTAYQVGQAVSGHFPEGITSFFCYRQRTLVFVNEAPAYLDEECLPLKPKGSY